MDITIDNFSGPLDLLLHLIKKDDLDIFEVNIIDIIDQYLEYINSVKDHDLNIASEYLIMAAELIEIKSSILLPKPEIDEDDYEEDKREEIINRLIEYEKYKEVTSLFKDLESIRRDFYTKEPSDLREYIEEKEINDDVNLDDLVEALNEMFKRRELDKPLNTKITTKEYSVTLRSKEIKDILKKKKKVEFTFLFDKFNKSYIVVTFLSILNLAKNGEIDIKQKNNFNKILLIAKDV